MCGQLSVVGGVLLGYWLRVRSCFCLELILWQAASA
jgi:hypothetical protein